MNPEPLLIARDCECPCTQLDEAEAERDKLAADLRAAEDTVDKLRRQLRLLRQLSGMQGRGELLTRKEVAQALGTTAHTIHSWQSRYDDTPEGIQVGPGQAFVYDRLSWEAWAAAHRMPRWKRPDTLTETDDTRGGE